MGETATSIARPLPILLTGQVERSCDDASDRSSIEAISNVLMQLLIGHGIFICLNTMT